MVDEASPFLGWDCEEYLKFSPKASNDVLGSFYFFLRHTLLRFCRRIKELDIHFHLSNIDARVLPAYLSARTLGFSIASRYVSLFNPARDNTMITNTCSDFKHK